ncbi:flagellar biosynthetic protein FliR [Rhodanobacter sp. PCA2]|uniref:flagellar biosynthetic protein FliR n=1 Tax=Rhodanobacter sp. PCA2 TaxID=2006117 RepID=UPI001C62D4E1|nr:flagellar biosynthetic protein FliR [Rhodanobacter sp. PCA2]
MTLEVAWLLPWLDRFLWVLARVGGLCLVVPVFGATVIPRRVRLGAVVMLTLVLAPLAPAAPDVLGASGMLGLAGQLVTGAATGFVLKLVFDAVQFGGGLVGQGMSLGFAEVVDPQAGGSANVLGQFYLVLATLLFLAMDGHLRLIALLADSFASLPPGGSAPGGSALGANGLHAVLAFGVQLFGGAVRVALPAVTSLLVVNIGFAAISRAAPSMNLFAVGFPITVSLGFIALWLSLRSLPGAFDALQGDAWDLMHHLLDG